jgi:hypothetical protein
MERSREADRPAIKATPTPRAGASPSTERGVVLARLLFCTKRASILTHEDDQMSGRFPLCQLRLGTVEYLFFDARTPAPPDGRLLSTRELQRFFSNHGSRPGLRALLRSLARDEPSDRVLRQVCCYEIEHEAPALSPRVFDGSLPPTEPFQPSAMFDEQRSWVEVWLVGENDEPISGELCEIELPDGKIVTRKTNRIGLVRLDDIPAPGRCKVRFPGLDEAAWAPA